MLASASSVRRTRPCWNEVSEQPTALLLLEGCVWSDKARSDDIRDHVLELRAEGEVGVVARHRLAELATITEIDRHLVAIADDEVEPATPRGLVEARTDHCRVGGRVGPDDPQRRGDYRLLVEHPAGIEREGRRCPQPCAHRHARADRADPLMMA